MFRAVRECLAMGCRNTNRTGDQKMPHPNMNRSIIAILVDAKLHTEAGEQMLDFTPRNSDRHDFGSIGRSTLEHILRKAYEQGHADAINPPQVVAPTPAKIEIRMTRKEIQEVTTRTANAYSFDTYKNWRACTLALANMGFDAREAEAILRSKYTRWAGDRSDNQYGEYTSSDLVRFLKSHPDLVTPQAIAQLVAETFPN